MGSLESGTLSNVRIPPPRFPYGNFDAYIRNYRKTGTECVGPHSFRVAIPNLFATFRCFLRFFSIPCASKHRHTRLLACIGLPPLLSACHHASTAAMNRSWTRASMVGLMVCYCLVMLTLWIRTKSFKQPEPQVVDRKWNLEHGRKTAKLDLEPSKERTRFAAPEKDERSWSNSHWKQQLGRKWEGNLEHTKIKAEVPLAVPEEEEAVPEAGKDNARTDPERQKEKMDKHTEGTKDRENSQTNGEEIKVEPQVNPPPPVPEGYRLNLSSFMTEGEFMKMVIPLHEAARAREYPPGKIADAGDKGNELESLETRTFFINMLWKQTTLINRSKVCIVSVTSADQWGLRKMVFPWIQYHLEVGVGRFYLFYDGSDERALQLLQSLEAVHVTPLQAPFANQSTVVDLSNFEKGHKQWGGRPGNYALMVKQAFAIQTAISLAKEENMDWILHLDQDELFVGDKERTSNLAEVLHSQPRHVASVKFFNNEAYPEQEDVFNSFDQVTLFKVNPALSSASMAQQRWKAVIGTNRRVILLYGNGKSAARLDAPGLRQAGPHEFRADRSQRWVTPENPDGDWVIQKSECSTILHYAYCTIDAVLQKAERSCPPEYKRAAILNERNKTKECFVIDFDQDAYHVAARGDPDEIRSFFLARVVLEPGAVGRCYKQGRPGYCLLEDVEGLKTYLLRAGLLQRNLLPQKILRMHERMIQNLLHVPHLF